uniref:Small ribosomal subunit protein mS40 n=1 Tax=Meleagris gallopavo TaxID=9103 RepID=A0A803Y6R7_MELGA
MGRTGREFGGSWENWEGIWREWKGTGRTGKEFEGDWEGIWGHWDGFYGRASHHFPPPKRKGKRVGNPCPICRDQNLHVDFRNVKLLEQFVCPHSGSIFHPTHTGVCMKQHKLLLKAIAQAQDHGLLWLRVPFVPTPSDDYLTQHSAVGKTPPGPQLREGRVWYPWPSRWRRCPQNGGHAHKMAGMKQNGGGAFKMAATPTEWREWQQNGGSVFKMAAMS